MPAMTIKYEPAHVPMVPAGGCRPGALALSETMRYLTPGLINSGCYNPRTVAGSSTVSLHAEGRAIDIRPANYSYSHGPWLDEGPAKALSEWVAALIENAEALGIQQILWAGHAWRIGRGYKQLTGNKHYDHAHIELTRHAAATLLPSTIVNILFNKETPKVFIARTISPKGAERNAISDGIYRREFISVESMKELSKKLSLNVIDLPWPIWQYQLQDATGAARAIEELPKAVTLDEAIAIAESTLTTVVETLDGLNVDGYKATKEDIRTLLIELLTGAN